MERQKITRMDDVISGGFTIEPGRARSRDPIRVLSWNIERGLKFSAIRDFLRTADADVILLQEVDLNVRRTEHRDVALELARSLSLNYVFGREFQELGAGSKASPAHHGLATLSPWPLENGRILRFRHQSNFWEPRWYVPKHEVFQRRIGGRIALVAEVVICRQRLVTYNLHLESRGKDVLRLEQLREALEDARQHTQSSLVIVGGDFNLNTINGDAGEILRTTGFHDAVRLPGFPTTIGRVPFHPARCIDWIYVSGEVRSEGQVHKSIRASDHRPISATLDMPSQCDEH
jgi:endonuclease/exonuclease/phosphatase family metal-dependent hydrolase